MPLARNLVNLESVSKAYGERPLLEEVSLGVGAGERIAVVGRNGAGKSTLLRVMAGDEPGNSGRVSVAAGTHVALLRQDPEFDPEAIVLQAVVGNRATHEWAVEPRVRDVLSGLLGGFDESVLSRRLGHLSGGERRRVELARLLVADLDLLLLDEPTNHLDVDVVAWLATYLRQMSALAVVVVTHDRWFIDEVCDTTWEVVGGKVEQYEGGYSAYVLAKAERARQQAASEARRANLLRKELAWLRRGAPARTSKPKFRIDAANALINAEPPPRDSAELLAFADARLGRTVVEAQDATVGIGGTIVLDALTWNIGPGQRIGILGANGTGKTTLVRTLIADLRPVQGRIVVGQTVRVGFLSQHLQELDPSWRVLEAVEQVAQRVDLGKGRELTASQLCERLGFGPDAQWTPVGDLSGGERRRLQLTRILMSAPNVLVLDEPTNDFDVETLTALEDLLDGFAGTLLIVSHDRYFLERVCDDFMAIDRGRLVELPGGVEQYLARAREAEQPEPDSGPVLVGERSSGARDREVQKGLARLERQIERLKGRESELHAQLAEHATDYEKAATLHAELRSAQQEREGLEEQWLELAT